MNKALKIVLVVAAVLVFFLLFGKKLLGGVASGTARRPRGSEAGGWLSSFLTPVAKGTGTGLGAAIQKWFSPAGGTPVVPEGRSAAVSPGGVPYYLAAPDGAMASADIDIRPPVAVEGNLQPDVPLDAGTVDVGPVMV